MTCQPHASMTLTEKVREAYHAILSASDRLPDDSGLDRAAHLLGDALKDDLASPYCRVDGCGQPRMESFPECPQHFDRSEAAR
jgi:hypothetical protein